MTPVGEIVRLRTAEQWLSYLPRWGRILDPDGWRRGDGVTYDTPITFEDFERRYCLSTVRQDPQ